VSGGRGDERPMGASTVPTAAPVRLDDAAYHELARSFRGSLVRAGDAPYEERRRIWNGAIDRHPALIAPCTGSADVVAALKWAVETGAPVAVRSGGHSFPGHSVCDGGVVIDLSAMREVRVDPEARTVRVQAGVLLGELDAATQPFGLAVPSGIVTHTGVAGLTLGGGIGWLSRKYGLSVDQLLSVDLVTAAGERLTASAVHEPELFWGMRGAGGNFGIVTEFTFRLNPVGPTVLAGPVMWPVEESAGVMRFYRDWITGVPDELTTIVVHRKAPPAAAIPAELHGRPVVMVIACWAGEMAAGEDVMRPLREFGRPLLDLCRPKPYLAHQAMFDASFPHGWWYYFRGCGLDRLADGVVETMARYAGRIVSPQSGFPLFQLGGAVARVGEDDTAAGGRGLGHMLNINGIRDTSEGFAGECAWVREFWSALEPYHAGVYVNFLMDEGEQRIRQAYGSRERKLDRLRALKAEWDPGNVFRLNQNIPPA
ncbi:FAD-binding oxidoreductase, partial [Streptomyces sp. NPDC059456]|uniref:FAD-binding oxidoreductase n=1 Tax=Streptomyces sp. NPDC059456 TaxID=3346838 RepID=UPI00368E61F0